MDLIKLLMVTLVCLYNTALAEDFAKTFLRIPLDAVSRSVGGFNQAYSIGAVDLFINPALLSRHTQKELQFSNVIDLLSNQFASFAFSMPVSENDHVGVGLVERITLNIPENRNKVVNIRTYNHYQVAVFMGYSHNIFPFSIGSNIKYYRMGYDGGKFYNTATALGFDLGLHYILNQTIQVGFIYQTAFDIKWDDDYSEPTPGRMGIGVGWTSSYIYENFLQLLFSLDRFDDENFQTNMGFIFSPLMNKLGMKNFSIRAGLGNFDPQLKNKTTILDNLTDQAPFFTVGTGLEFDTGSSWSINLDYCFQIQEYVSNQHIVTTRISF